MKSSFSSNRGLAWFCALLLLALTLPIILHKFNLISSRVAYSLIKDEMGNASFTYREIFEEKSDLDILFVGTSILWNAIDTTYIQHELSKRLNREAKVAMFGNNGRGEDLYYTLIRETLLHRKIKLLVLSMVTPMDQGGIGPHNVASRITVFGQDPVFWNSLSFLSKIQFYAVNVLNGPRELVEVAFPSRKLLFKAKGE